MDTRECACCGAAKPVSHVWYAMAEQPASFLCGTCFHEETGQRVAELAR
jgi:hypothetical protein